ncbi:MAG TPA: acetyl ornithine aminotransferase family protein [Terracidiphilus sp.]|nr:acetyl ornithine aminotransferase family protein [Terracidiphilus sp.]
MTQQELHAQYGPRLRCPVPGPKARAAVDADKRWISPSYTRSYPLVARSGRGLRVEDVDGNEFLDFAAGIAVVSTGHCHPQVVAAIQKQAAELIHISGTDFFHQPLTDLAEQLSATAPMRGPHRFFYGNSGAEAIECALKLARYHTGRQHVIAFLGAFHGRTMGALSLTGSKPQQKRRFAPLVPGVTHIPYPNAYRAGVEGAKAIEEYNLNCARYLEDRLFKTILPPEEVAAIFVEPVQGEGGYVVAPDNFLRELRAICNRHGILLVADEVQSGCGRTGQWWAIQHSGVEPDIVCMAKGIASGMPLGVCMSRAEIMDWVPGSHASTFGGNPVCLAAAQATIDVLQGGAIANASRVGEFILDRVRAWKKSHPMVGDVRGRGLMIGIEIVKDKATREPAAAVRNRIETLAFERGLLVLGCGENSIRLCPPLIVSEQEASVALDILEDSLSAAEKEFAHATEQAAAAV